MCIYYCLFFIVTSEEAPLVVKLPFKATDEKYF